jgi:holo-[acyl-carrier protein] synthase
MMMTRLATGIDLIEVQRIQEAIERHGARFLERIYTPEELVEAANSPASLAARFAAKEAAAKALGCGIGAVGWQDIEILRGPTGKPGIILHGSAAHRAAEQGLESWSVSLSHTREHAVAVVVGSD